MALPSPKNICLLMAVMFIFNIYWMGLPTPVQGQNLFNNLWQGGGGMDLGSLLGGAQQFIGGQIPPGGGGGGGGGGGP